MTGYRYPCVLDWLVGCVQRRPKAPMLLDAMFEARLSVAVLPFVGCSFFELATIWTRQRAEISGIALAALLWRVVREPSPVFRQLERQLVADIEVLALRAYAT